MVCKKLSELEKIIELIEKNCGLFDNYHYYRYPSAVKDGWLKYLRKKLLERLEDNESIIFYNDLNNLPVIIIAKIPKWDESHFGFKLASLSAFTASKNHKIAQSFSDLLFQCEKFLKSNEVRFVSARINGDDLDIIHTFENAGYRYYEDVIWPVADCRNYNYAVEPEIRLMNENDVESVMKIAANYQYKRGHYHCDLMFDINKVDEMYAKWVSTSFNKAEPVIVVELDGKIAGYFVLKMDRDLSDCLGYTYGRMRSLAVDSSYRKKGLGMKIFRGAIAYMKMKGAEFIDSGYSTKNHVSAILHTKEDFKSVYEEVTFHKWLF